MKFLLLLCGVLSSGVSFAQDRSVLLINDSLRKYADVINRDEEYILTLTSPSKYTLYERHVYTILNSTAEKYAGYKSSYNRFNSINSISGKLYNALGKEIKHTKKNDWSDNSSYDGFSLLSDERYKKNEFYFTEYPSTVEYEEEDLYNGIQAFPRWMPQANPSMSVEHSKFTIIAPADYTVRYKEVNYNSAPVVTQKGNIKTYVWEMKNIPAKDYEIAAPPFSQIAPIVFFAPSKFEAQGYSGDMSTWEDYGKFIYQLIKGRDVLPADIKSKVHELTDTVKSDKEKVYILYDFLQKNTRYISIQLGIGGWQPFEAGYVAQKQYGDCKALSNYMIALLKEAGIAGKYVEVYAGDSPPPFIQDFSFSQANHVIACVPIKKDTLWLECTSQTKSPGYMGSFTGNRKAILIDETGGHLVQTPLYNIDDNVATRKVKAITDDEGNLDAEIYALYSGLQQDFPHALMYEASNRERQEYLNQMFNLPTYEVLKNDYKEYKGIIPAVSEYLHIQMSNYATITGKRLFITPDIFGGATEKLVPDTARQYDYLVKDNFRYIDTIEIKIPKGYSPESIPQNISIKNKFGKYVFTVAVAADNITCYRLMEQYSGSFPPKDFAGLVKFKEQVYKSDRSKIVLVKSE